MAESDKLGVLAHRGGLVVRSPQLRVGVVQAVSRPDGLAVELFARRPPDRRSATERQSDIRAGRDAPSIAPRRLLPPFDDGLELRVGWLDRGGRPHWVYGPVSSNDGDHLPDGDGPSLRTVLDFPPLFDHVSMVLAWPEIGFPETVVDLSLPDRTTVERDTVSIWRAPVHGRPGPPLPHRRAAPFPPPGLAVEEGRVIAEPRVLSRDDHAAVVLSRLTAVGPALSMQILTLSEGDSAAAVSAAVAAVRRSRESSEDVRAAGSGASVAVVRDGAAAWAPPIECSASGGSHHFRSTAEFLLSRPDDGVLDLVVAWPVAGLDDVRVRLDLDA